MSLNIFGIPHKRLILKEIKSDISYIPILHSAKPVAFGMAEKFKDEICVVSWYICREVLHDNYPTSNHLFVLHEHGQERFLKKFIKDIESKLGLQDGSKFYKTYRKSCSLILLDPFWSKKINFTLFTLLVRFCLKFNKSRFVLQDLSKCEFLKQTMPALSLVLDGKFRYFGKKSSWFDQFRSLNLEQSSKYLR